LFEFECKEKNINFPSELINYYNIVFHSNKESPKNNTELIKLLVDSYKLLVPELNIIDTNIKRLEDRKTKKRTRIYKYSINEDNLKLCNDILNIYGFIKRNETNDDIIDNIEFIDNDDPIKLNNNNSISNHVILIYNKKYQYTINNKIIYCSHCNYNTITHDDIYEHIFECGFIKNR
jgi:hypothetical protein